MNKRARRTDLEDVPLSEAPPGYHYWGQRAHLLPNGRPSLPLRPNDTKASREIAYQHLYFNMDECNNTEACLFLCTIKNCSKNRVPMARYSKTGKPVFQNFLSHLQVHHPEYLMEQDRNLTKDVTYCTTLQTKLAVTNVPAIPPKRSIYNMSHKIVDAMVSTIIHGGYPISMLNNPALQDFLKRIDAVPQHCTAPSPQTMTRKIDKALMEEHETQNKAILTEISGQYFSGSFDEWSSRQNIPYLGASLHAIKKNWSGSIDYIIACSHFPFPHDMPDVRVKVLEVFASIGVSSDVFDNYCSGLTYDGASVNAAFNPSPHVGNLSRKERDERAAICKQYEHMNEFTCICHRLNCLMENVLNDPDNVASKSWNDLLNDLYGCYDKIKSSQKNEQELKSVQANDKDRVGRVVLDIKVPKTRWNYNSVRIARCIRLFKYVQMMDTKNMSCAKSRHEILEWKISLTAAEDAMKNIQALYPIVARIAYWTVLMQSSQHVTVSLMLYMITDLKLTAKIIGDKCDDTNLAVMETIASKFEAEMEQEFADDLHSDIYKLAQLFDPRVTIFYPPTIPLPAEISPPMSIDERRAEIDRLLTIAKSLLPVAEEPLTPTIVVDMDDEEDAIFTAPAPVTNKRDIEWDSDVAYFKTKCMMSVKRKIKDASGAISHEYWGGVAKREDIDVHKFYAHHSPHMPILDIVVRRVLCQQAASASPERIFTRGGLILSPRRCGTLPARAEGLIVAAARYVAQHKEHKKYPKLPVHGEVSLPDDMIQDAIENEPEYVADTNEEDRWWEDQDVLLELNENPTITTIDDHDEDR